MRVLLTCHPGHSHLNTMAALAEGLREAGHHIAFATARSFVPTVEAAGFEALPAGPDWEASVPESLPQLLDAAEGVGVALFAQLARRGMVGDLVKLAGSWKPDLFVRDATEFGGWVAAELLDLPLAVLVTSLGMPRAFLQAFTADLLTGLPAEYGLPPDPTLERLDGATHLHMKPVVVDPPGFDPPPNSVRFRHAVFDTPDRLDDPSLPEWIGALDATRPIVHASLGTVFSDSPAGRRVNRLITEALRDEAVTLVVAIGRHDDLAGYGRLPDNVRLERFMPYRSYEALLRRCDALITHGGFNTVLMAIARRLPMAFMPLAADQPVIASRFTQLGVGINCATRVGGGYPFPRLDPDTLDPAQIGDAVRALLGVPGYRTELDGLHAEFAALPPVSAAVETLERLV